MGRYLDMLKKSGSAGEPDLQNLQNPPQSSFVGFVGTPPPGFRKKMAANEGGSAICKAERARVWLLHFPHRDALEVWYAPPATHAEALAGHANALAAEPIVAAAARPCAIRMTADEEQFIRAWMERIEESDPAIIVDVLDKCRRDLDARDYCIRRAAEDLANPALFCDDLRTCTQCSNLVGRRCQAAKRGEIVASRNYEPIRDMLKRCEGYAPNADDPDRRHGRERWPGLIQKGHQ